MMVQDQMAGFRNWLKRNTKLSDKVVGDTISRLARIEKMVPIRVNVATEDFLFKLGKNTVFCNLGPSVKSQLKRAYTLYHQFCNGS